MRVADPVAGGRRPSALPRTAATPHTWSLCTKTGVRSAPGAYTRGGQVVRVRHSARRGDTAAAWVFVRTPMQKPRGYRPLTPSRERSRFCSRPATQARIACSQSKARRDARCSRYPTRHVASCHRHAAVRSRHAPSCPGHAPIHADTRRATLSRPHERGTPRYTGKAVPSHLMTRFRPAPAPIPRFQM